MLSVLHAFYSILATTHKRYQIICIAILELRNLSLITLLVSHQLQWLQHWMAGYTQMQTLGWWGCEPYTQHGRPCSTLQLSWSGFLPVTAIYGGWCSHRPSCCPFLHNVISETAHTLPFSQLRTQDLKRHTETGKKKASSQAVAMANS